MVGRKKVRDGLSKWIASDGELGEAPAEYYIHVAAKFLQMSYADLDEHPRKFSLMRTALTLHLGLNEGMEIWRKNQESKRKVNG